MSSIPPYGADAVTLMGKNAVILAPQYFKETPAIQDAIRIYEEVHAYAGWDDAEFFEKFHRYGLPNKEFLEGLKHNMISSHEFTTWIDAGCPQFMK